MADIVENFREYLSNLKVDFDLFVTVLRQTAVWIGLKSTALPYLAKHIILGRELPKDIGRAVREKPRATPTIKEKVRAAVENTSPSSVSGISARRAAKDIDRQDMSLRDLPLLIFMDLDLTEKQHLLAWNQLFPHHSFSSSPSMLVVVSRARDRLDRALRAYFPF